MRNVKHIYFDLDRTLWDFEKNSHEALTEIVTELGLNKCGLDTNQFIEKYKEVNEYYWGLYRDGKIEKEKLRYIRFQDTLHYFEIYEKDLGIKIGEKYVSISPKKKNLIKGTMEVLDYLKPHFSLHIITNGFEEVQEIKMKENKLTPYFDTITCSEEVNAKKPDPKIFLHALEKHNAKAEESVMIGDDYIADITGANKINMKSIYFNPKENDQEYKNYISCLTEIKSIFDKRN
jgi:putative hydrolase of the HAD superfamily